MAKLVFCRDCQFQRGTVFGLMPTCAECRHPLRLILRTDAWSRRYHRPLCTDTNRHNDCQDWRPRWRTALGAWVRGRRRTWTV